MATDGAMHPTRVILCLAAVVGLLGGRHGNCDEAESVSTNLTRWPFSMLCTHMPNVLKKVKVAWPASLGSFLQVLGMRKLEMMGMGWGDVEKLDRSCTERGRLGGIYTANDWEIKCAVFEGSRIH